MKFVQIAALAAVLGTVGFVAASCGGGSSSGVAQLGEGTNAAATTPTSTTSQDPQDAILAFTRCLRKEGIDLPDPSFGQGGGAQIRVPRNANSPKFQKAQAKCRPLLAAIQQRFDPEQRQKFQDAALAYAKCMRGRGFDVPDPDFSQGAGGGLFRIGGGNLDPSDPKVQTAMQACQKVFTDAGLPGGGPGGGPGRPQP